MSRLLYTDSPDLLPDEVLVSRLGQEGAHMAGGWRFPDSEATEVITLNRILAGESSVLLVTHDQEDGAWQFLDGEHVIEDDGVIVRPGEMVQFDPSLEVLADLPRGWHAWRSTPSERWQFAAGEPSFASQPDQAGPASSGAPGRNIEIKARVCDFERLRSTLESMSESEVEILDQEDLFFSVPRGRLKLRIQGGTSGELIHYDRPDTVEPKVSCYRIAPTIAPTVLKAILSEVLPVAGIVRKRRLLYRLGQNRIHLDQVEQLGDFLELEVVLRPDQAEAEGVSLATDVMSRLGITREDLVPMAYIDLLPHVSRGMIQHES
jgi:predicted adenylyl cyclase CyaB